MLSLAVLPCLRDSKRHQDALYSRYKKHHAQFCFISCKERAELNPFPITVPDYRPGREPGSKAFSSRIQDIIIKDAKHPEKRTEAIQIINKYRLDIP